MSMHINGYQNVSQHYTHIETKIKHKKKKKQMTQTTQKTHGAYQPKDMHSYCKIDLHDTKITLNQLLT